MIAPAVGDDDEANHSIATRRPAKAVVPDRNGVRDIEGRVREPVCGEAEIDQIDDGIGDAFPSAKGGTAGKGNDQGGCNVTVSSVRGWRGGW